MNSFSYLEPVCCSMSSSNCCFLTCIQISQEADHVVWYSHLFQNFPQFSVIHTVKGFGIVKKAEIDVFLELSCFFHDPADVGNRDSPRLQCLSDPRADSCILFPLAACHTSCLTCVGPAHSHCTQCRKPEDGLQFEPLSGANITSGECLSRCRAQFYLEITGLCEGE